MPITGTPKDLSNRSFDFASPLFNGLACFYWGGSNTNLLTQRAGLLTNFEGGPPDFTYENYPIAGVTGGKAIRNTALDSAIYLDPPSNPLTNDLPGTYGDFTVLFFGKISRGGTFFSVQGATSNHRIVAFTFIGPEHADGSAHNVGMAISNGSSDTTTYIGGGAEKNVAGSFTFRRSGAALTAFKNGVQGGNTTTALGPLTLDSALLGRRSTEAFTGQTAVIETSLLLVYKRALSDSEIAQLSANPFIILPDPSGGSNPPPAGQYRAAIEAYHVGNSISDTLAYQKFQALARANTVDYIYGRQIIPGAPLEWLRDHPNDGFTESPYGYPTNALPNFDWDVLTLQPFDRGVADDIDDSTYFMNLMYGRATNAQARTLIYSRWPRQAETSPGSGQYVTYNLPQLWARTSSQSNESKAHFEAVVVGLRAAHPSRTIDMVPVGDTLLLFDSEAKAGRVPGFTQASGLFQDAIHLTEVGAYLVGCVFYATMYKESPVGLTFSGYSGVTQALATKIQELAWTTVRGHQYSGVPLNPEPPSPPTGGGNSGLSSRYPDTVLTAGTKLRVGELGANRTLPTYSILVGANASAGAQSVSLRVSSGSRVLPQGTTLNFGGIAKTIVLADDANLSSTGVLVPIVSPLGAALSTTDTATTPVLFTVYGGSDATFSIKDNEAPTRSFESGLFDDAKKVMVGGSISWQGTYRKGDLSITLIESCACSDKELFVQLIYPDGKQRTSVAFVQNYNESNTLDSVRELSWEFRLVGAINLINNAGV